MTSRVTIEMRKNSIDQIVNPLDVVTDTYNEFTIFRVCEMSHFENDLILLSLVTVPQRTLWNLKAWLTNICLGKAKLFLALS